MDAEGTVALRQYNFAHRVFRGVFFADPAACLFRGHNFVIWRYLEPSDYAALAFASPFRLRESLRVQEEYQRWFVNTVLARELTILQSQRCLNTRH